jgi:hypothetical protein
VGDAHGKAKSGHDARARKPVQRINHQADGALAGMNNAKHNFAFSTLSVRRKGFLFEKTDRCTVENGPNSATAAW